MSNEPTPPGSPPAAPAPSSTAGSSVAHMQQMVEQVDRQIHDLYRTQRIMRLQFLFSSLLILLMMAIFGFSLYSTVQQRLDQQKLQAALLLKAEQIWPSLSQKLINSLSNAAPVYRDLAKQRWEALSPVLETKVRDQGGLLAERLQKRLVEQSNASMYRVAGKLAADLKRDFPNLTEDKLKRLGERLKEDLAGEGGMLAEHVKRLVEKERAKVEGMMERLPVQHELKLPKDQLQRQFIHNILMLIDYEASVLGTKEGIDQMELPVK